MGVLNEERCKKLDPTLQSDLRLGCNTNKKVKRKTNKKRKYKKLKLQKEENKYFFIRCASLFHNVV